MQGPFVWRRQSMAESSMTNCAWTGANQAPLRSESSFGVLLRLSAFNHLGLSVARKLFARNKSPRSGFGFYRTGWIDEHFLNVQLGWTWQSPEKALVLPLIHLQEVLWAPALRYCPLCMQGGFHALWFQLAALQTCPFHGCPLTGQCGVCGISLGLYGLAGKLFDHPLHCCHCQSPFAGAPIRLSDSLDIWQQADAIDASFDPFARWLEFARERLICLDEAVAQRGGQPLDPHAIRLLQSAVHDMAPYPHGCESREGRSVGYICWRLIGADSREMPFPTKYRYLSTGRALDVYRATLRALIRSVEVRDRVAPPLRLEFERDRSSELGGWRASQLALVLLRCAFEKPFVLDVAAPIDGIGIRETVFAAALVGNRLQRSACHALILATYGMLIARAREYIVRGYMSRTHLIASPREIAVFAAVSDAGTHAGMAVMPAPDDKLRARADRMMRSGFTDIDLFNHDINRVRFARGQE
jgi:hypothetical protein